MTGCRERCTPCGCTLNCETEGIHSQRTRTETNKDERKEVGLDPELSGAALPKQMP